MCFGDNEEGQSDVPADLGPVVAVSACGVYTVAMKTDGQLVCFGQHCPPLSDPGPVASFSVGDVHVCAVRASGELVCLLSDLFTDSDGACTVPADMGPVEAVSAGHRHTCAIRSSGQLVCFGSNKFGQRDVPADLGAVVAVAAGDSSYLRASDGWHTRVLRIQHGWSV